MSTLTVALIQADTCWHDAGANRALFDQHFARVPAAAEIVVLPEMLSTGFTMDARDVAESMSGPTLGWMSAVSQRLGKVVCGSVVIVEQGRYLNRFVWSTPDGGVAFYDKRHLFRMAGEHRHYTAGTERLVVEYAGWRICPIVCYDLRFPVWMRNRGDYDVSLVVANWPAVRQTAWNGLLRARAIENQCYTLGVNRVGVDGNRIRYRGGSAAYDFAGETLLEVFDQIGVFTVTLQRAALDEYRREFPAWQDADQFDIR